MKNKDEQVSRMNRLRFRLKRKSKWVGRLTPKRLRMFYHRQLFRKRIAAARAAAGDSGPRLPREARVHFAVAGAQKAGTTALLNMLGLHPDVVTPVVKEPHFFCNDGFFVKEEGSVEDYHLAFPYRGDDKVYGEGTPNSMLVENSIHRMRKYNSDFKIICILRDPVQRAFSGWNMNYGLNEERGFKELIELEKSFIAENGMQQNGFEKYLSRGMYAPQVQQLRSNFPPEQLLFIRYEQFKSDNLKVVKEVFDFIGVDSEKVEIEPIKSNVIRYKSSMNPELEKELRTWFKPHVEALERELGWDLSDWKPQPGP